MRILIVEDDLSTSKILSKYLAEIGECQFAVNGIEALEKYKLSIQKKQPFDLVCLDILLPGDQSGLQVLEKIRCFETDMGIYVGEGSKILMISSMSDDKTQLKAFINLCDGFVAKPFNKKQILNKLKDIELL